MTRNELENHLVGLFLGLLLVLAMVGRAALLIWACRTLFGLSWDYTLQNILAVGLLYYSAEHLLKLEVQLRRV